MFTQIELNSVFHVGEITTQIKSNPPLIGGLQVFSGLSNPLVPVCSAPDSVYVMDKQLGREHRVLNVLWITDPHLDHLSDAALVSWFERIEAFTGHAVLLTGDIAEADSICDFLAKVAHCHHRVWFVLGNHDYYGSSISMVREKVAALSEQHESLTYLHAGRPIHYTAHSVVLGVDGWADGRAGDFMSSPIMLNDYRRIADLSDLEVAERCQRLNQRGDEEAQVLLHKLQSLDMSVVKQIRVGTHVPPFAEACWYEGSNAVNEWTPHFTSIAVGRILQRFAAEHPQVSIVVYCGHSHHEGRVQMQSNLQVYTGGAMYGDWLPHTVLTWS